MQYVFTGQMLSLLFNIYESCTSSLTHRFFSSSLCVDLKGRKKGGKKAYQPCFVAEAIERGIVQVLLNKFTQLIYLTMQYMVRLLSISLIKKKQSMFIKTVHSGILFSVNNSKYFEIRISLSFLIKLILARILLPTSRVLRFTDLQTSYQKF